MRAGLDGVLVEGGTGHEGLHPDHLVEGCPAHRTVVVLFLLRFASRILKLASLH